MTGDSDTTELEEQLAEALARIDELQMEAADAQARAATVQAELKAAAHSQEELRSMLREAAGKYRAARLAATPDVPADLVPELETIEEIDREFESATRVVEQLREKLEKEAAKSVRGRVPAGSPARREADVSSLSPGEKIRLGLRRLEERT
jgi:chromosome segregation ATPase